MPQASKVPCAAGSKLAAAIAACLSDAGLLAALRDVYARVDAEARRAGAVCLGGGACCRFDRMGHRLYVSTGELALLCRTCRPEPRPAVPGRCPYQVGPRCAARADRPLGCRVYFCRPALDDWCRRTYETHHLEIRRLHETHGVDYSYVELTAAMAQVLPADIEYG